MVTCIKIAPSVQISKKDIYCAIARRVAPHAFRNHFYRKPSYWYERPAAAELFTYQKFICHDGIINFILNQVQKLYGNDVLKESFFITSKASCTCLHIMSRSLKNYESLCPKIFFIHNEQDFWTLSRAGGELAELNEYSFSSTCIFLFVFPSNRLYNFFKLGTPHIPI